MLKSIDHNQCDSWLGSKIFRVHWRPRSIEESRRQPESVPPCTEIAGPEVGGGGGTGGGGVDTAIVTMTVAVCPPGAFTVTIQSVVGGDRHVAQHGQLAPAAQHMALHCGDPGFFIATRHLEFELWCEMCTRFVGAPPVVSSLGLAPMS